MEPTEAEVPIKLHIPDEPIVPLREPLTPKTPILEESVVPVAIDNAEQRKN